MNRVLRHSKQPHSVEANLIVLLKSSHVDDRHVPRGALEHHDRAKFLEGLRRGMLLAVLGDKVHSVKRQPPISVKDEGGRGTETSTYNL